MSGEIEDQFIYFKQANLWKSNNASHELGQFLNKVIKYYRYFDDSKAGIMIDNRPEMDRNYINRLKRIGILVNENDEILSRPSPEERHRFKARARPAKAPRDKDLESQRFVTAMAGNSQQQASPDWVNLQPRGNTQSTTPPRDKEQGSSPCSFVCGLQEPYYRNKKIPGLRGHTLLIDGTVKTPRAAIFHSKNLNIWPVNEFTDGDICTGVLTTIQHKRIYISSVYLPHEVAPKDVIPEKLARLVSQAKREKAELILMLDANAWSKALWNSATTND